MFKVTEETLINKIRVYNETLWETKVSGYLDNWLSNFKNSKKEKLYALYLLSNFMFFGSIQIRELLKSLFRDIYKYPILEQIRINNNDTLDSAFIYNKFNNELNKTMFSPVGNPSESGSLILYYFRQENNLPIDLFKGIYEIFDKNLDKLRYKETTKYIFIDDFCGTGSQLSDYHIFDIAIKIKKQNPNADIYYYSLFADEKGFQYIKDNSPIIPKTIFLLDKTYKCFLKNSRFFSLNYKNIHSANVKKFARKYGNKLFPESPLGYKNCQLLLGFHHNTPDNSLPIFWGDLDKFRPIFKRYLKIDDWENK